MMHVNPLQALGPVATRETCCKFMMGLSFNFTKLLQRFTLQKPLLTLYKPNVYPKGWHRSIYKWYTMVSIERKSEKSNTTWFLTNQNRALWICVWFFWFAIKHKFYATGPWPLWETYLNREFTYSCYMIMRCAYLHFVFGAYPHS